MGKIICWSGEDPKQYQQIILKDFRQDEASIIAVLTAIKARELPNDLVLLNYYKEVPVSFGVAIDFIDRGLVAAVVHHLQAPVMLMQKTTLIKSAHLPHVVQANVQEVKLEENVALLSYFSYVKVPADRRKYVRVKVSGRHEAVFRSGRIVVRGTMRDICIGGVALFSPEVAGLDPQTAGIVTLELFGRKLDLQARLIRIGDEEGLKKYIFELEVTVNSEDMIARFVNQQQAEIIKELKQAC